jgi:hypothetical protein
MPTPTNNNDTATMHIDLRQAIYALTDALDLVGVDEVGHGKRVGFMAAECSQALPLDQELVSRVSGDLDNCWQHATLSVDSARP